MARALIISNKEVSSTPRVLREVSVLEEMGIEVSTVGWGKGFLSDGYNHIELPKPNWITRYVAYLTPFKEARSRMLAGPTPAAAYQIREEDFSIVILHDPSVLSTDWIFRLCLGARDTSLHIDFHEDFTASISRNWVEKIFFERYRQWEMRRLRDLLKEKPLASLSTVSKTIARNYEALLGINVSVVANTPDSILPSVSEVSSDRIDLVHHGVGTFGRGIESSVKALKILPDSVHLNLMLVSSPLFYWKIQVLAWFIGVNRRLHWLTTVATEEIPVAISKFDIALVFIEPVDQSELLAMPNKLFESTAARLAIACGPNPDISDFVSRHHLGIVAKGWNPSQIAETVMSINNSGIMNFKHASSSAQIRNYLSSSRKELRTIFAQKINGN